MVVELRLVDPAFLFPGISLLFLAYTNRYLALANIVRNLNQLITDDCDANRIYQIKNLKLRIAYIKLMQFFGALAFIFCVVTMMLLFFNLSEAASYSFFISLSSMLISLVIALIEITQSGKTLDLELERTQLLNSSSAKVKEQIANLKYNSRRKNSK